MRRRGREEEKMKRRRKMEGGQVVEGGEESEEVQGMSTKTPKSFFWMVSEIEVMVEASKVEPS